MFFIIYEIDKLHLQLPRRTFTSKNWELPVTLSVSIDLTTEACSTFV
jgi:hypothetical protein